MRATRGSELVFRGYSTTAIHTRQSHRSGNHLPENIRVYARRSTPRLRRNPLDRSRRSSGHCKCEYACILRSDQPRYCRAASNAPDRPLDAVGMRCPTGPGGRRSRYDLFHVMHSQEIFAVDVDDTSYVCQLN